jgi:molybdate transport system regulatory protein
MSSKLQPKIRILIGAVVAIGPGKADLLEAIGRTGSISAAGREMDMSYRRAWMLVEAVNASFAEPLVVTATGGRRGGGALLTPFGKKVLARYRAMEASAGAAVAAELRRFSKLLRGR